MLGFNFDLLDQLSFYGSYHRHPVNKLIHLVCVPGIAWSALVWFASAGALVNVDVGGVLEKLGVPSVVARCARARRAPRLLSPPPGHILFSLRNPRPDTHAALHLPSPLLLTPFLTSNRPSPYLSHLFSSSKTARRCLIWRCWRRRCTPGITWRWSR